MYNDNADRLNNAKEEEVEEKEEEEEEEEEEDEEEEVWLHKRLCTQSVLAWGKVSHQYILQLPSSLPQIGPVMLIQMLDSKPEGAVLLHRGAHEQPAYRKEHATQHSALINAQHA
ncbi:hypothetical protein EYF80_001000 [Liparis tanakae]|uniref:Uncharacterized protein n=1 Tax=Liparis tanakae TaxID=230148 RepID=A0A4Z2JG99_9TELE|nr:hypothetical protein EYF80_001000 [Liparis tanakae]